MSEIATDLDIPLSSALAILRTLVQREALEVNVDKRYRIGPALFYVGSSYATGSPLYRAAWTELVRLADELVLSATLAVPWETHHLVLAVHSNTGIPNLPPGSRIPIGAGAYGKAYFAWSGQAIPRELVGYTPKTVVDSTEYAKEVELVKQIGFATDNEELLEGAAVVCASVGDGNGYAGTLALWSRPSTELVDHIGFQRAGSALSRLAAQASTVLGDPRRDQPWHEEH